MIVGQCLLNKNENATVSKFKKFLDLNKVLFSFYKGTHDADSIIEFKIIYYLEQCRLRV